MRRLLSFDEIGPRTKQLADEIRTLEEEQVALDALRTAAVPPPAKNPARHHKARKRPRKAR
ncbi:MAG TPA: hypothetical protein VH253_09050 [Phycisphaerae bacterium]|nr:hypothetical protein [Phycisphaerae bacterium]